MGITRNNATAYTGIAWNRSSQPGRVPPASRSVTAIATAAPATATYPAMVIAQSRYSPVARAYSLNANSATSVTPAMNGIRPPASATIASGAMITQPRQITHSLATFFLSP
jgi:hypothetical protein